MNTMSKDTNRALAQEKELMSILIDSSLYVDMSPDERQKLLNYLVSSYFTIDPRGKYREFPGPDHS